jgi:hypothetical protein
VKQLLPRFESSFPCHSQKLRLPDTNKPFQRQTMKTATPTTFVLLALLPLVCAREEFVARIPNGANVPDTKAIGHSDGTGSRDARNDFGDAFENAGKKWTSGLCQADTDNDGQTNGQELGDPCCVWTVGDTPLWTDGVSHPGDSAKTSNESLWASVNCSTSNTAAAGTSGNAAASSVLSVAGIATTVALTAAMVFL